MGLVTLDLQGDRQISLVGRELSCTDDMSRETLFAEMGSDDDFCLVVDGRRDMLVQGVQDSGIGCAKLSVHIMSLRK